MNHKLMLSEHALNLELNLQETLVEMTYLIEVADEITPPFSHLYSHTLFFLSRRHCYMNYTVH